MITHRVRRVTVYQTEQGWRWHVKARNGVLTGASTQAYNNRHDAEDNLQEQTGRVLTAKTGGILDVDGCTSWTSRLVHMDYTNRPDWPVTTIPLARP